MKPHFKEGNPELEHLLFDIEETDKWDNELEEMASAIQSVDVYDDNGNHVPLQYKDVLICYRYVEYILDAIRQKVAKLEEEEPVVA